MKRDMGTLRPKLDILPPAQRAIWNRLSEIPPNFVLYGGTAIALRLGHRSSVDFDFFSYKRFVPIELFRSIPLLRDGTIEQNISSTLTVAVNEKITGKNITFSFFGVELNQVLPPSVVEFNRLKVASMSDLFGMKCATVYQRADKKDYCDIDAILLSGMSLYTGIATAQAIYGTSYVPSLTLKALSFTGDVKGLPGAVAKRLEDASRAVDLTRIPAQDARNPIGTIREKDRGIER
jgi:hypothetical protein